MSRPRRISSRTTSSFARRAGTVGLFLGLAWALTAGVVPCAGQLVSVTIVPFHDESDAAAPGDLLDRIGRDFRQKLTLSYKDLLPRFVGADVVPNPAAASLGDLAAIGKQQGAKFLVRGGILAITSEKTGSDLSCSLQLFADLVDTETLGVTSLRTDGAGIEINSALEDARRWNAYTWTGPEFARTALGQAIDAALTSLADQVHAAMFSPPGQGAGGQTPGTAAGGIDPYQSDQEMQQLMAQAESLISSAYAANLDVTPLQQSLDGVRSALDNKLQLLQQGLDAAAADQDIAARRSELENQVNNYSQQIAANPPPDIAPSFTGGKADGITRINGLIENALGLLQKIQEIRLAFGSSGQDQGNYPTEGQYAGGDEFYPPTEEETGAASGVVTENGAPVEGATVTDPETGLSAATDENGSFTLGGLPGGRITNLQVIRGGKLVGVTRIALRPGQTSISDLTLRSGSGGLRAMACPVVPSSLILSTKPGQPGTGRIVGIVRDGQGRPVPRALVSVKGVGAVRTDSQGRYMFANVPVGGYQLAVQQPGGSPQLQQVRVGGRQTASAPIVYRSKTPPAAKTAVASALAPGENTLLKGRVTEGKNKAIGGAKVTVVYPGGALRVYSNNGGVYQVRNLKPGSYKILAAKPGYEGASGTAALQKGKPSTLDLKLARSSSEAVQQALASRQQKQAPPPSTPPGHPPALTKKIAPRSQTESVTKTGKTEKGQVSQTPAKTGDKTKGVLTTKQAKLATGPSRAVAAATSGSVQGTVTDGKTRGPVAGATVSLKGKPSVQTDSSGRYGFRDVAPGSYSISVRKTGYKSGGGAVTVKSGQTATANVTLTKEEVAKKIAPIKAPIKKHNFAP